jgi:hypothetical protein
MRPVRLDEWPCEGCGKIVGDARRFCDECAPVAPRLRSLLDAIDCEHEVVSRDDVCLDCGVEFHTCDPCSEGAGAGLPVKHTEPLCFDKVLPGACGGCAVAHPVEDCPEIGGGG